MKTINYLKSYGYKETLTKIFYKFLPIHKYLLYLIYGFDKWHLSSFYERKYAIDIVKYINNNYKNPKIAEIGCGLSDILSRIKSSNRYGYDQKVLKANKFYLYFKKINFIKLNFLVDEMIEKEFDLIILCNWIHEIDSQTLKTKINNLEEILLLMAGRSNHINKIILPSINKGKIVISDRFVDSTLVYQGFVNKFGISRVKKLHKELLNNYQPDYTFIFKLLFLLDKWPAIGKPITPRPIKDTFIFKSKYSLG